MDHLIQQLTITGLAASVSPIAIVACIDMLSFKNPIKDSLAYLLGFTLTLLVLGMAGVYLFQAGASSSLFSKSIEGYIDIALGVICFALLLLVFRKRPARKKDNTNTTGSLINPSRAFVVGTIVMLSNFSTLVIYISGLHIIGAAKLGMTASILSLGLLTLITLITVIAPIVIYILSPQKAGKLLASIGIWLNAHSKVIGAFILVVFGFYLIMRGLRNL